MTRLVSVLLSLLAAILLAGPVHAQDGEIDVADVPVDVEVAERLSRIFAQIDDTEGVTVAVQDSVVTLTGEAANDAAAERAVEIARRVDGVVAVQDDITRTLDVSDNVAPVFGSVTDMAQEVLRAGPLFLAALVVFAVLVLLGRFLANRTSLLQRFTQNPFILELLGAALKVMFVLLGIIAALNILGATALVGTVLGGAGILGIALGFGIRDTVENYIASLLLSLRQPFRAQDHVVIEGQEGIVIRLNTRATILMTLDGNHLRIPNARVFKADILNYSTNPERRFTFQLGVDSADDPVAAISRGKQAMAALPFVLPDPPVAAKIIDVGDSSIVIEYAGWIDQRNTGFASARSQAIRDVKDALESGGFSLPEPIYRLKVEGLDPAALPPAKASPDKPSPAKPMPAQTHPDLDTDAELTIAERVAEERERAGQTDLLDSQAPPE